MYASMLSTWKKIAEKSRQLLNINLIVVSISLYFNLYKGFIEL